MRLRRHHPIQHLLTMALNLIVLAVIAGCAGPTASGTSASKTTSVPRQATSSHSLLPPTATGSPVPVSPRTPTPAAYPTQTSAFDIGDTIELTSIHMMNETEGWGFSSAAVWITRDGTRTWRDVTPRAESFRETGYEWYGGFVDANHAWLLYSTQWRPPLFSCIASDASVWYTTDGGQTWKTSRPLMHSLADMSCSASFNMTDTETGWLSINGFYTGAGPHTTAEFFRTTDGGTTWNAVEPRWSDSAGSYSRDTPGWLSERVFYDRTGWQLINMSDCWPCYGNTPAPAYYLTRDGGFSWSIHLLPPPSAAPRLFEQYLLCEPYQLNLLTEEVVRLKLACSQIDERQEPRARDFLYSTTDGGMTWNSLELPRASADMSDYDARMIFFDADHGLLLGREMWRTADGGVTWQHINTVTWEAQFSFVDPSHGWAIARAEDVTALVYTINGGEDWQLINPTATQ